MPEQAPLAEIENVAPGLLLPPPKPRSGVAAALAGGGFELCDRIVCLSPQGAGERPPLGARGTVRAHAPILLFGCSRRAAVRS